MVCMAMLMLSLIKSILVVKLLHHSEKEVRQMSVSACLLDKYGSSGRGGLNNESALTSTKTLDRINASGGKKLSGSTSGKFILDAEKLYTSSHDHFK